MALAATSSAASSLACHVSVDAVAVSLPLGPEWTSDILASHQLGYFGGFVVCTSCGGLAQRSLARSKLKGECKRHLAKWQASDVRRISERRIPRTEYKAQGWPDGGKDLADGRVFRRIRRFSAG